MPAPANIYHLKVTLPYIEPVIWRRLEVHGDMMFSELHYAIQRAMGWEDDHLWAFYVGNTEISPEREQFGFPSASPPRSADRTTLNNMLSGRCTSFRYVYDMGDDWVHDIVVEKVVVPGQGGFYPRCTGGARACPPEDCGGFHGYMNILAAMSDPKHPEREEMLEWVGEDFDPEAFNVEAVNRRLQPRKRKLSSAKKK